ncbi:hypothetical protein, partial [Pontibacter aquaedesilientis]|uniref:hypothetical protein n=1 Tax=Pontibacter aquaedesilientis TaxID=2766980 RepID=UPI001CD11924
FSSSEELMCPFDPGLFLFNSLELTRWVTLQSHPRGCTYLVFLFCLNNLSKNFRKTSSSSSAPTSWGLSCLRSRAERSSFSVCKGRKTIPNPQAKFQSFFSSLSTLPADRHSVSLAPETFVSERVAKVRSFFELATTFKNFFPFPFPACVTRRSRTLPCEAGCKGKKSFSIRNNLFRLFFLFFSACVSGLP